MKKHRLVIGIFVIVTALLWSGFAPDARPSDEPAISTGLSDALYGVPFLDGFNPKHPVSLKTLQRGPNGGYLLGPGSYSGTILSYCLQAGAYAPYEGDGFLYAPLKGAQAEAIRKILKRSTLFPGIPQDEIQTILWSIEDGVPIAEFPLERQCYLTKLLSEQEIERIDGSTIDYELLKNECQPITEAAKAPRNITTPEEAMRAYGSGGHLSPEDRRRYEQMLESNVEKGLIPPETLEMYRMSMEYQDLAGSPGGLDEKKLAELQAKANELNETATRLEQELRGMLTSLTARYEQIERVAVLFGRPPEDKTGKKIPVRRWSYHPDGYFIRFDPDGYSDTAIDVYVPEKLEVTRDVKGRITGVRDAIGNSVKVTYDDSREPLVVSGEPSLVGYPMSSIVFDYVHPQKPVKRLHLQWDTTAWTFVGTPTKRGRIRSDPDDFPGAKRRYERIAEVKSEIDSLDKQFSPAGPIEGIMDLASLAMALEEAYGDLPVETLAEAIGAPRDNAWVLGDYGCLFSPDLIPGMCDWDRFPAIDLVTREWMYEMSTRERAAGGEMTGDTPSGAIRIVLASLATDIPAPVFITASGPNKALSNGKIEFDPSGIIAVPGNSNEQRLGMSVPPTSVDIPTPPPKDPDKKTKCDQIKALEKQIRNLKKIRDLYWEVGKTAKDWYDLENRVREEFKKWLVEENPGAYPAGKKPGTTNYGVSDPCRGTITELPDVCGPPFNIPFPLCYYMNAAALAHEQTHVNDAADDPTERNTFCTNDPALAKAQVDIAVRWEQHAYDVQIEVLEQGLDNLKKSLDEPCD
jgi:uncharacterized membrane protein